MSAVKVNRPPRTGAKPAAPQTPVLRVLNRAFDDFDPEYDPTDEYAEIAHRVRQEEGAW